MLPQFFMLLFIGGLRYPVRLSDFVITSSFPSARSLFAAAYF